MKKLLGFEGNFTFDYSQLWQANRDRDALAALNAAHGQGALFSINHPAAIFTQLGLSGI